MYILLYSVATYFSITQPLCLLPEHLHPPTHPATHIRDKYQTYSTVQCTPYCDGRPLEASVAQPVADPSPAPNPESPPPPPPEASTKTRSKRWCLDSQLAVRPIAGCHPALTVMHVLSLRQRSVGCPAAKTQGQRRALQEEVGQE